METIIGLRISIYIEKPLGNNDILLTVITTYFFLLFSDLKCSRSDCVTKSQKSHQNPLVEEKVFVHSDKDVPNF